MECISSPIMWKAAASIHLGIIDENVMSRMRSGQCHFWSTWEEKQWSYNLLSVILCSFFGLSKNVPEYHLFLKRVVQKKMFFFIILQNDLTVLKYSIPDNMKASATSLVVTTHDMGWPLPIGFPMVTMSGTKSSPWSWKAQKWVPTRPKPTWTSSAMKTPPALRTCLQR